MGVGYELVNHSRQERLTFTHMPANKALELSSHPATSAMTTWYLLTHLGDRISFVSDSYGEWPFPDGSREDLDHYRDVTHEVVDELIARRVLIDEGNDIFDEDEPDVYVRRLRVCGWEPIFEEC